MRIGLVLAGGGGKGAYQLGVWKALKYLNLTEHISIFSGASIGAFNSVMFAANDTVKAEELWKEVTMDKLVPISKKELVKRGAALYIGSKNPQLAKKYLNEKMNSSSISKDGAIEMINKYIDCNKAITNKKICYAACTDLSTLSVKYFKLNDYSEEIAKDIILASASLPLIYDSTEVNGIKYIDGGISDNIPIQPVYGENCDIIIVVVLNKEIKIDRSLYPNSKLIIISPESLDENTLTGTLNLDNTAKFHRIREGYNDTLNKLEPIMYLSRYVYSKDIEKSDSKIHNINKWFKKIMNK